MNFSESKNLSTCTVNFYKDRLNHFSRYLSQYEDDLGPSNIKPIIIREYLIDTKSHASSTTANHCLSVVKRFFNYLETEGFIKANPAISIDKQKTHKPIVETFSPEQIEAILATCKKDFYGIRDRAILLLLGDQY
ncbi:MAG: tyrosine-type recombinase/integrase [Armatimonadota bacterium]